LATAGNKTKKSVFQEREMQEQNADPNITKYELEQSQQSGARWFFWIAALSLINSIASFSGSDWGFAIGLGTTQFIDGITLAIMKEAGGQKFIGQAIALTLNAIIAGVFVLFGVFAKKGQDWAFILGMVCYAADGLLSVLIQDWLSLAFHGFAIFCIWGGMQAGKRLNALRAAENAAG
jgi:hypothetical protein